MSDHYVSIHEDRMLTVSEVAKYLRLSKSQVYLMVQKKKLPYIRLSERRIVVRKKDLEQWIDNKFEEFKFTDVPQFVALHLEL